MSMYMQGSVTDLSVFVNLGEYRAQREVNARNYIIDCLLYWYPRLQERHDKSGRLLYRALGEILRGYPDSVGVTSGQPGKLIQVCARMFNGVVADKWVDQIKSGNVKLDGKVINDKDTVVKPGTTLSWEFKNFTSTTECSTEDTILNSCVDNILQLAEEEWGDRIRRGRVRVDGAVAKDPFVDVIVGRTLEHYPNRRQHRAVASLLAGDINKRVSTSNLTGDRRSALKAGSLMSLDRPPRSELMANVHWQKATFNYFVSDRCSRLLGEKKNVKTISVKKMSRRLQELNQLTDIYEVDEHGNLCPRPARFMTTTQKDAYLGKSTVTATLITLTLVFLP